jgi:hypothetical protein
LIERSGVNLKILPVQVLFDNNFPDACGAEQQRIIQIAYVRSGIFRQRTSGRPDKNMRIQKERLLLSAPCSHVCAKALA